MKHIQIRHKKFVICKPILPCWYIIKVVLLDGCNLIQNMTFSLQIETVNNGIDLLSVLLHEQPLRLETTAYNNLKFECTFHKYFSVFHIWYTNSKKFMWMEEDRGSSLQCKDAFRQLLPLVILWVLYVTFAVVTFTSEDSKNRRNLDNLSSFLENWCNHYSPLCICFGAFLFDVG